MSLLGDLKVLYHLALKPVRGNSHADRLESFYAGQAGDYDEFRKRLLQGRSELWSALLKRSEGGIWVDMGGGTGANLENFGEDLRRWDKVYVVDLSKSLLEVAADRAEKNGWTNVEVIHADATEFQLPQPANVFTFSYSLTMIPDWFAAIDAAKRDLPRGRFAGHCGLFRFAKVRRTTEYAAWLVDSHGLANVVCQ